MYDYVRKYMQSQYHKHNYYSNSFNQNVLSVPRMREFVPINVIASKHLFSRNFEVLCDKQNFEKTLKKSL